ncbi:MAG: heavy metal-associated domain-containing protein [Bacteroidota bacterium]|nr:heavy metal-associated domain-containing protein [Bacteroidota bacterium]
MKYLFIFVFLFIGCKKNENTELAVIKVPTIVCDMCETTIKKAIFSNLEGVKDVTFDPEAKTVAVTYVPKQTNIETIEITITRAGYDANDRKRDPEAYENLPDCCKHQN